MAGIITIEERPARGDAELAEENRGEFDRHGIFVTTLVGASGSGKTSLLERSIPLLLQEHYRVGVIEADPETDLDARRIAALSVPVVQIITGGTSHLQPRMIQDALHRLDLQELDLVFIEEVGGLVGRSAQELGGHLDVVVMSITEGEDKPLKYPGVFRRAGGLVISKIDLLSYIAYDLETAKEFALEVNADLRIFETTAVREKGIRQWTEWLLGRFRRSPVCWQPANDGRPRLQVREPVRLGTQG